MMNSFIFLIALAVEDYDTSENGKKKCKNKLKQKNEIQFKDELVRVKSYQVYTN